jgi:2-dehydropantoate 2-reductase
MSGAIWSKLLINCSVTTIGAVAGRTMREYIATDAGRAVFACAYGEALAVALASGARPETMYVDPIPPGWTSRSSDGPEYAAWLERIVAAYGDLKPSMLQDFERGRRTEIEFINGYVAARGDELGVPTPVNDRIIEAVRAITAGVLAPDPAHLAVMLSSVAAR